MRKIGKIVVALITVLTLGLVVAGCSCSTSDKTNNSTASTNGTNVASTTDTANATDGARATDNTSGANATSSDIVGTWKYEKGSGANADYTVIYNADGTGKMINRLAGSEGTFTYTIDNGTVKMEFADYPQAPTKPIPYVVEGDTLILKYNYGDVYHTKEK